MRRLIMVLLLIVAPFQFIMPAAFAEDKSPWLVRLRLIDIAPNESSTVSIGGAVTADIAVVPELDITYFWTDNIATELILATSKHTVGAVGTALGDLDLGTIWVLPPTLLLQYHLNPDGRFRPYIGAGLNYTLYYNGTSGDLDSVEYDNDLGFAFQAGLDIGINDNWAFNIDVKKIYLNSNARINGGAVTADVSLDPWVFGAGLAYRF
ncbi:MAG: OmpW family protein [Kordiimonadaceae bacterium]|nr:OmpW family protein [Kordiimonadaceae bacterium]